ncbi:MAG: transcriptional repressor [Magnetococcales bacterium]|nr:transcriptional repressor [Magnetococcales bacterium]
MSVNQRLEWLARHLSHAGHRVTHQRLEVFREVIQTDEHPDAEMVFQGVQKRVPSISRNTVYQTLQFLVDQGCIAPFGRHHASHRYDRNMERHQHLVCIQCGKVTDVAQQDPSISPGHGDPEDWGRVDSVHVEWRGVCRHCLTNEAH